MTNSRRKFLAGLGTVGVSSILPAASKTSALVELAAQSYRSPDGQPLACTLIPSETRGPYPLDLSSNQSYFRRAINETKTGVPLSVVLNFVNVNDNCKPIPNARVDIWHCDKDGVYSGYSQPGSNTVGQTFCRGIQITDANGQVTFTTIYPGWYAGRITHIHFEIYLSSVLNATSQMAFPEATTTAVYNSTLYAAKGQNTSVRSFAADNVFSDGTSLQMSTITGDLANGYTATLNVGINAPRTTGLLNIEPETGGQFKLGDAFPNPFREKTLLPFELFNDAQVQIELYNVEGRKVREVLNKKLGSGEHSIELERKELSAGVYAYQLSTQNELGVFRKSKVLTIL